MTTSPNPTAYIQFINDDPGFLRWKAANPNGFIVNSNLVPVSSYLKLHRSTCSCLSEFKYKNFTTTGFIKTCSLDPAALDAWAVQTTGGHVDPCKSCRPPLLPESQPQSRGHSTRAAHLRPHHPARNGSPGLHPREHFHRLSRARPRLGILRLDDPQPVPDSHPRHRRRSHVARFPRPQHRHARLPPAEFCGVDPLTRHAPEFRALKQFGLGVPELASLWQIEPIRNHLLSRIDTLPFSATLDILRNHGGTRGRSLADAFARFPWRKFHWSVRALLQNSALLQPLGGSFRNWLVLECTSSASGASLRKTSASLCPSRAPECRSKMLFASV